MTADLTRDQIATRLMLLGWAPVRSPTLAWVGAYLAPDIMVYAERNTLRPAKRIKEWPFTGVDDPDCAPDWDMHPEDAMQRIYEEIES